MEKKLNIWNDYQNQKNYDLSFKTVDDNAPDHIVLKETKDDRGKNGEQWDFKIVSKDYIDSKNAEQDETARQQQAQITEHSHTLREHDQKLVEIKEKDIEQDNKLSEIENKNTEQDGKILEIENKNTEQDGKLTEHENRLEQLDGGHTSNLGKIGEIETTLDDHKGRLELLETETETYNTRIFKKNLSAMELKLENVLSLVKATISIQTKKGETFTSHLSGLYVVDKNNNHNNNLNLFTDSKDNEKFYHIELSGDESFLIKIIHTKEIEIEKVSIDEYNQTILNIPFYPVIDKRLLPVHTRGYRLESNIDDTSYLLDYYITSHFTKYDENVIIFEVNCLMLLNIKNMEEFDGLPINIEEFLNDELKKEILPKYTEDAFLTDVSFILVNNLKLVEPKRKSGETYYFKDLKYYISKENFNIGNNVININFSYYYNVKDEKKRPLVD